MCLAPLFYVLIQVGIIVFLLKALAVILAILIIMFLINVIYDFIRFHIFR